MALGYLKICSSRGSQLVYSAQDYMEEKENWMRQYAAWQAIHTLTTPTENTPEFMGTPKHCGRHCVSTVPMLSTVLHRHTLKFFLFTDNTQPQSSTATVQLQQTKLRFVIEK